MDNSGFFIFFLFINKLRDFFGVEKCEPLVYLENEQLFPQKK